MYMRCYICGIFAVLAIFSYLGFYDMSVLGILFLYYICELSYCTYMSWINFIIIIIAGALLYTSYTNIAVLSVLPGVEFSSIRRWRHRTLWRHIIRVGFPLSRTSERIAFISFSNPFHSSFLIYFYVCKCF